MGGTSYGRWLRVAGAWTVIAAFAGSWLPGCGDSAETAKKKPDPIPTSGPEWSIDVRRPVQLTPQARFPERDPGYDGVSVTADGVTIHYKAKPTIDIDVGNVIAGEGYLREVVEVVSRTSSEIGVKTKPAYLVDLILDGSFKITQTPFSTSFEAGTGKTSFPLESAVSLISTPPLAGFKCSGGVAPFTLEPNIDIDFDPTLDIDIEATSWIPPRGKLVSGEFSIKGGVDIGATLVTQQAGQSLTCALNIVDMLGAKPIKLPGFKFVIPPGIPVWIEQEFYPIMEASISAQQTLNGTTTTFGVGFTANVGTKYDPASGWTSVFEVDRTADATTTPPVENQYPAFKVSAGLKAGLGWAGYLYGAIGPKVGLTGGITGSYSIDPNSCSWQTSVDVGANLEVGAEIKVPAIDVTLAEIGFTQPLTSANLYDDSGIFPECCGPGSDAAQCVDAGDADADDAEADAVDATADASDGATDAGDADASDGNTCPAPVTTDAACGEPCTDAIGCKMVEGMRIFRIAENTCMNGKTLCAQYGLVCTHVNNTGDAAPCSGSCFGLPVFTQPEAACLAFHPGAQVTFDDYGWGQAIYCDNDTGPACAVNGCHYCPACYVDSLNCSTNPSTTQLLSEVFVRCDPPSGC